MKISYNWLKQYISEIPEPKKVADAFSFHLCEVESVETLPSGDTVFDLNILPNRAHDLLSHMGVARELAGLLGLKFVDSTPLYKTPESVPTKLSVEINTPSCRRYMARVIRNVKIGPSSEWVVQYLEAIGGRSINNIVDATNIVMQDCGGPTHAFDLSKLQGEKIKVSSAKEGEVLKLVGREALEVTLKEGDVVITDGTDTTLALGGIKGGIASAISENTTDIVIEVANFDPVAIRKTARRLNLLSDAAKRFQNDLSPEHVSATMHELSALIFEFSPDAIFEDIVDVYPNPETKKELTFSLARVNKLLGTTITGEEVSQIFKNYSFSYTQNEDAFTLEVPYLRGDLQDISDIAEEIGRIYGYDKIVGKLPEINSGEKKNETYMRIHEIREKLMRQGYKEVMTYTFRKRGDVEIFRGPKDKNMLRTNLLDGLQEAYTLNTHNQALIGEEIKIFEVGTVFSKNGEATHVALIDKNEKKEIKIEEYEVMLGEKITKPTLSHKEFTMWSLYPFSTRDISFWVPEGVTLEKITTFLSKEVSSLLVKNPKQVDMFEKEGRISYTFSFVFQSFEKTLTDEEINIEVTKIENVLKQEGFEIR